MVIDTSGEAWRGDSAADLADYLEQYAAGGYHVDQTVSASCAACAGRNFRLRADPLEGGVERTCVGCGETHLMLDSADAWEDAEPHEIACSCTGEVFEVAVGFSLLASREVRWISVGVRCVADGVLGCCADWKIDYSPSRHLLELA
ncbi:hypothetical protein [Actinomadura sp. 3N407]|uniref:hypothetical protein n=1 Tax=Actinomadura sp. 3N407 TaxID=3457423 RepID=UPI003FCDC0E7